MLRIVSSSVIHMNYSGNYLEWYCIHDQIATDAAFLSFYDENCIIPNNVDVNSCIL